MPAREYARPTIREGSCREPARAVQHEGVKSLCSMVAVGMVAWLLSGCSVVGPERQRLVSKPNMQFSRAGVYTDSSKLLSQVQPGLATTAGAQASTCTLCR